MGRSRRKRCGEWEYVYSGGCHAPKVDNERRWVQGVEWKGSRVICETGAKSARCERVAWAPRCLGEMSVVVVVVEDIVRCRRRIVEFVALVRRKAADVDAHVGLRVLLCLESVRRALFEQAVARPTGPRQPSKNNCGRGDLRNESRDFVGRLLVGEVEEEDEDETEWRSRRT